MSSLKVDELVGAMQLAASGVLKSKWSTASAYSETEFKKLALAAGMIETGTLSGEISKEEAVLLWDMQKNAARSVLLTIEGLGVLAAEEAINIAIAAVKGAINSAVRFDLIN